MRACLTRRLFFKAAHAQLKKDNTKLKEQLQAAYELQVGQGGRCMLVR